MGGRLDATNIVDPLLSIVTDISLDHTEWLGSTISAIAREKAGILRPGGTLITLPQHPEANQAIGEVATELDARGVSAVPYMPSATSSGPQAHPSCPSPRSEVNVASPLARRPSTPEYSSCHSCRSRTGPLTRLPRHTQVNCRGHSQNPLARPLRAHP